MIAGEMAQDSNVNQQTAQDMVVEADTGARRPDSMLARHIILYVALAWSLFQLWIAAPLQYELGIFIFNSTETRSLHLGFAVFLAFLAYPGRRPESTDQTLLEWLKSGNFSPIHRDALILFLSACYVIYVSLHLDGIVSFLTLQEGRTDLAFAVGMTPLLIVLSWMGFPQQKRTNRHYIPVTDWLLALIAAFCAAYLFLFYRELSTRPGLPTSEDIAVAAMGIIFLLEATRRALGPPLMIVATVFLFYTFAGAWEYMPELISHKGQSMAKVASHQWLTTEGVYGIALGVSTSFVFLFVLFGALLDKAGAGNYFIKLAFSMLGHLRGGPAKAAVLSSGMTGLISGSSIANVVTTGTFTIPLMKRVGFSREKAGAVEVASSVNGQIMPPVMGAAAFMMVEYVGIPYIEVIRHAFLPALISYIALLYMVHLEAVKANMSTLPKPTQSPLKWRLIIWGIIITSLIIVMGTTYYLLEALKTMLGSATIYAVIVLISAAYLGLLAFKARYPDLAPDDPDAEVVSLPETGPTVKTGLHYLLPIVVLVWCLMVERLSPGLSAFWAVVLMMVILVTQRPIVAIFRKATNVGYELKAGLCDLHNGLITGARNMIGIGVATAAAGIIVGTVSLTGIGQVMTEVVEVISGGSFLLVLIFTAVICLILGMGLPTTANYIVVASIMTPVIVELGAQNGLIIPLIAVHLFVFYFGIMADVTPPVGLASFAAAAVSGGDPIRTGVQAFLYSSRTVILPFIFIYNHQLLLIDVESFWHELMVFIVATIAILVFSAGMQGYFFARNRLYETAILFLAAFSLLRPGFWVDMVVPPYESVDPVKLEEAAHATPVDGTLRLKVSGEDLFGEPMEFFALLSLQEGESGAERLEKAGLFIRQEEGRVIVDDLAFNSQAEDVGLDFENEIIGVEVQAVQPAKELVYIPVLLMLGMLIIWQRNRGGQASPRASSVAGSAA